MNANYCAECGVEGIPDHEDPNHWQCPKCKRDLLSMHLVDELQLKDAVGAHGHSRETRDGLPIQEFARHVAEDGGGSSTDIERDEGGRFKVSRSIHPSAPAPRDAQGERKRAEELKTVRILLPLYNKLHGTAYESVVSGKDDLGDDVIAESPKQGEVAIRFQLTFAESHGSLRASISRGKPFSIDETEEDFLKRVAGALTKKSLAPDLDAVLVLDGAGIVAAPGTVERFVREHGEKLVVAPFREVWWVDHAPNGVIRRLWPDR